MLTECADEIACRLRRLGKQHDSGRHRVLRPPPPPPPPQCSAPWLARTLPDRQAPCGMAGRQAGAGAAHASHQAMHGEQAPTVGERAAGLHAPNHLRRRAASMTWCTHGGRDKKEEISLFHLHQPGGVSVLIERQPWWFICAGGVQRTNYLSGIGVCVWNWMH